MMDVCCDGICSCKKSDGHVCSNCGTGLPEVGLCSECQEADKK